MKKFQPATVSEHLQALYVQGHDWALDTQEALLASMEYERKADLLDDLCRCLTVLLDAAPGSIEPEDIMDQVEARLVELSDRVTLLEKAALTTDT